MDYFVSAQVASEEITSIATDLSENEMMDPIERSISALLSYQNKTQAAKVEQAEVSVPEDMLNIFTNMRLVPGDEAIIIAAEMDKFQCAIINSWFDARSN